MSTVNIINQSNIKKILNHRHQLNRIINKAVKLLKLSIKSEINIIFVNPDQIKKLNFKYFNNKFITDVISFKSQIPINHSSLIADIIICPQEAKRNAKKNGLRLDKEIQILILHGLLHLTDLNHEKKSEQVKWNQIFQKLQNIIVQNIIE